MYLGNQYYIEKFRNNICIVCGLCEPDFPAFCMTTYASNPERFFKIVKYIRVLKLKKPEMVEDLYTFEGFCGLFCNSQPACPNRTDKCKHIGYVCACYEAFADQAGLSEIVEVKRDIWKAFSDKETNSIGRSYSLPSTDPVKMLSKKQRKKLGKVIKKIKHNMSPTTNKKVIKISKKKKPVVTTLFYNDDEEWKSKIDFYLEKNEVNNRQPVANA